MISKIIESKPDELRTYLEEAAGISKYKENDEKLSLDLNILEKTSRLNDIMKEINASLTRLQKQVNAAEKYKDLKKIEETLRVILSLRKLLTLILNWMRLKIASGLVNKLKKIKLIQS